MDEEAGGLAHRNEVLLTGRVAAEAFEREMPSGDVVVEMRLIVRRRPQRGAVPRQAVDTIDCVAWLAAPRKALLGLDPGDIVELRGELHRRFFRGPGAVSRYEVEVHKTRRLARAAQLSA
jgi:single-strand DNA-binding protein